MGKQEETPLMRQYYQFKQKYPDAILLFRVGDFYETFGEDAEKASQVLGITLTKRNNGKASEIALAGFPYHALDNYLPKLVKAGYRVAVCDQLEDPKFAKGIVKRGVTEVLSPGVVTNDKALARDKNNYLCSLFFQNQVAGIAFCDISTGDFFCCSAPLNELEQILFLFEPSEVILPRKDFRRFQELFAEQFYCYRLEDWIYEKDFAIGLLKEHFGVINLKGFGIEEEINGSIAAGAILHYLRYNEQNELKHLHKISLYHGKEYVYLDRFTLRNLEIIENMQGEGASLFDTLHKTVTPMGSRLLKRWLTTPLRRIEQIQRRQEVIKTLVQDNHLLFQIRENLKKISDLERLAARLSMHKITPRELLALSLGLQTSNLLQDLLPSKPAFMNFWTQVPNLDQVAQLILTSILDEPASNPLQGPVMKDTISAELAELRNIADTAQQTIQEIQKKEAIRTGIPNLKIDFNKVYGFYIEITKSYKNRVPEDYERRQTLTNAERFITPELKALETKVLNADEQRVQLEQNLYFNLLIQLKNFLPEILAVSTFVAELDVLSCMAQIATSKGYIQPMVEESDVIEIVGGRHPVIETLLPADKPYIPNDVVLNSTEQQIILLTGPNMAGKSAFMRQVGLIVLMAQCGFWVPAQYARLGVVDKIFTRVGASDNLAAGESTFMVEMHETARILNNATPNSLVLLDEIGRGTATFDGIAIAWALVEFLHNEPHAAAKTIFATHYHELAQLADQLDRVKNYHVKVQEIDGKIIFMRKVESGCSEHSFGIQVAAMAGLPNTLINRAKTILQQFEEQRTQQLQHASNIQAIKSQPVQLKLFELMDEDTLKLRKILAGIDIDRMTPVEALLKLHEIKKEILDPK